MADLTRPVTLYDNFAGSLQINDAAVTSGGVIVGYAVNSLSYGEYIVRQVAEPWARGHGTDVGGVWVTGQRIRLVGTVYAATRAAAWDLRDALAALFDPGANALATLIFYAPTLTGGPIEWVAPILSEGIRFSDDRNTTGGLDAGPTALPYTAVMISTPIFQSG